MSRAAILPTPGDPFISGLWLSSFKKWKPEIDKLYVCVNSGFPEEVLEYTRRIYKEAGASVGVFTSFLNHGVAINSRLQICEEENILLVEDDFYILTPGNVNRLFQKVENNECDAVVSLRASCGPELHKKLVEKFSLTGQESYEPNFWPCLYFSNKKHLLKTDRWFDSYNFKAGEPVEELDNWVPDTFQSGDTFVWTTIQLRNKKLRFHFEQQHRLTTDDLLHPDRAIGFPWVHFGSTSSINGTLLDKEGRCICVRNSFKSNLPSIPDDHLREDYERRLALWELCSNLFPIPKEDPAFYFNEVYHESINKLITGCRLRRRSIDKFKTIYARILAPILHLELKQQEPKKTFVIVKK